MGFFIIIIVAIVVVVAIALDVVLIGASVAIIAAASRRRRFVWPVAGAACAIGTLITIATVVLWPYETVQLGSDYDIAAFNIAVQGFGCTISIGVGAAIGALSAIICPKKSINTQPTSSPSLT